MNSLIELLGMLGLLLALGGAISVMDRERFALRWLLIAAVLLAVNGALLTRVFGTVPRLFPGAEWNWQGMLLSLAATLAIAALPAFGWRRVGLTFAQAQGSLRVALPVLALYCAFFFVLALAFPDGPASGEKIAFQLTMPGLAEEAFFRGLLLFALDRAFTGRVRFLGVDWGWGAVLSCILFGLAHALNFSKGQFSFDPLSMALTALPAFGGVWMRLRTGSVLLPTVMHNFGNAISLLV